MKYTWLHVFIWNWACDKNAKQLQNNTVYLAYDRRDAYTCSVGENAHQANNNNSPNDNDVEFAVLPSPNIQVMKMTTNEKQASRKNASDAEIGSTKRENTAVMRFCRIVFFFTFRVYVPA